MALYLSRLLVQHLALLPPQPTLFGRDPLLLSFPFRQFPIPFQFLCDLLLAIEFLREKKRLQFHVSSLLEFAAVVRLPQVVPLDLQLSLEALDVSLGRSELLHPPLHRLRPLDGLQTVDVVGEDGFDVVHEG